MPSNSTNRRDYSHLIGKAFGELTIKAIVWEGPPRGCKLLCECSCGKTKLITKNAVVNDRKHKTISCGCRLGSPNPDALTHKPEYKVWAGVIQRCSNPNDTAYARYGARGISVCIRWRESFSVFLEDMGPRPSPSYSIDRIDNNGDYEPGNCRWATRKEQQRNRRDSRLIECFGEKITLAEWSERTGIYRKTIAMRIDKLGWTPERALSELSSGKKRT